jgi:hypothetical protein
MPVRQICPRYSLVLLLMATTWLLLAVSRRPHGPATPATLTELCDRLHRSAPDLWVVQGTDRSAENGVYVCTLPHARADLVALFRSSQEAEHWRGIVFCERAGVYSRIFDSSWEDWGEYCMQIGPLLFFGDPSLLQRLRLLLVKGEKG